MDAIPAPIFYKDAALIYRGCNSAFEDFIGLAREDIIGQSVYGVAPKELADVYQKADAELLEAGGLQIYQTQVRYADGTNHDVEFRKAIFNDPKTSEPMEMIGVILDLTELRAAEREMIDAKERAEKANRTKSEFLTSMSHELRTPLNAIIGFSEVIKDQTFGPNEETRYRNYAADIHSSGKHLLALIDDILDMAKIEAGALLQTEDWINAAYLLEKGCKLVQTRAESKKQHLTCHPPSTPVQLLSDERMVVQILTNLLSNAVKFTPAEGEITISGNLTDRGEFKFLIADNGIGIPEQDKAKIFERFHQAGGSNVENRDGIGLGLTIVRELVEKHGGTIELKSGVDEGTTATVVFPPERVRISKT